MGVEDDGFVLHMQPEHLEEREQGKDGIPDYLWMIHQERLYAVDLIAVDLLVPRQTGDRAGIDNEVHLLVELLHQIGEVSG